MNDIDATGITETHIALIFLTGDVLTTFLTGRVRIEIPTSGLLLEMMVRTPMLTRISHVTPSDSSNGVQGRAGQPP